MNNQSSLVVFIATIGMVFGLICLFLSFIPLIGMLSLYIAIPAASISLVSLILARKKKTNTTFPTIALTISLIGFCISCFQYVLINSATNSFHNTSNKYTETVDKEKKQEEIPYSYKIIEPIQKKNK